MNKGVWIYLVGIITGMGAFYGNFFQAMLALISGGILAGYLISKFTKEIKK